MPTCPSCSRRYGDAFERCSEDGTQLVQDVSPPTIAPGTTLDNGLTIKQFIGSGPTGEIYATEHQGQAIALKLLSPELSADQTFNKHLSRLLGHLAKVRHPGVAAILSTGGLFYQGRPLVARELVRGQSLTEIVRRNGPLPEARGLTIAMRVAEALTEAHRAGALHLNLKPSNIFVGGSDAVKLVDFGIGQRTELDRKIVYGDPRFLAPEQFEGKLVSFRSDIYGLGTLLYFILTSRPPFPGTGMEAERAVTTMQPTAPSTTEPGLAGHIKLDQVVLRALEKVPAKRYLSVQHFGRMMDGVLQEYHALMTTRDARRPPAHRTIPTSDQAYAVPSPSSPHSAASPFISPQDMNDTLRMEVPPNATPEELLEGPTLRERRPPPMTSKSVHDTVREGIPVPDQISPAWPNRQTSSAETLRMPVAPAPIRPQDTQPIPAHSQNGQVHDTLPAPPPPPPTTQEPVLDEIGIDIVEDGLFLPPPKKKKKKRKKKRKAPPIVAVRGEAALRLGPSTSSAPLTPDSGEAVMVDAQFLDEARGPERNLATMEIRVRPPQADIPDPAPAPQPIPPSPPSSGTTSRRKKKNIGRWILAAVALIFLFVFAAVGAAVLARWLSSTPETPRTPPPAVQSTNSDP